MNMKHLVFFVCFLAIGVSHADVTYHGIIQSTGGNVVTNNQPSVTFGVVNPTAGSGSLPGTWAVGNMTGGTYSGSFHGNADTATFATNADTASFATNANYSSFATNSTYSTYASLATNATSASSGWPTNWPIGSITNFAYNAIVSEYLITQPVNNSNVLIDCSVLSPWTNVVQLIVQTNCFISITNMQPGLSFMIHTEITNVLAGLPVTFNHNVTNQFVFVNGIPPVNTTNGLTEWDWFSVSVGTGINTNNVKFTNATVIITPNVW